MKITYSFIGLTLFSVSSFIMAPVNASELRKSYDTNIDGLSSHLSVSAEFRPSSSKNSLEDSSLEGAPLVKPYEEIVASRSSSTSGTQTQVIPRMKTGFVLDKTEEEILAEREKEALKKVYEDFERRLIAEAVQQVPLQASKHIEKFNAKMEILPDGVQELLPQSLLPYLSRQLFLLKSTETGDLKRIMISLPRLLNEYVGLKPDDSPLDISQKLGRLGFKLKDSLIIGVSPEEMRQLASDAFKMAGQAGGEFASHLDYMAALSNVYLSSAQSLYWAASLSSDISAQKSLLSKASNFRLKANQTVHAAPFEMREELARSNFMLEKRISLAESYLQEKEKTPSLPSLYDWNKAISGLENAFQGYLKKVESSARM